MPSRTSRHGECSAKKAVVTELRWTSTPACSKRSSGYSSLRPMNKPPEPADQKNNRLRRGGTGGRPPRFDAEVYKQRNVVERAINKLKAHRAVATRYDKRDYTFRGTIDLASIRIWLRDPVS